MIHSYELAPVLKEIPAGKVVCCVAIPVCLDFTTNRHLLATIPQHEQFVFSGSLEKGKSSYSILKAVVQPKNGYFRELCVVGTTPLSSRIRPAHGKELVRLLSSVVVWGLLVMAQRHVVFQPW